MYEIRLDIPEDKRLVGVIAQIVCLKCGNLWGIRLLKNGSLPDGGLVCRSCGGLSVEKGEGHG